MAWIRLERTIDVPPEVAWDALRDFGALHVRLAPGFAVDCRLEGNDRIVEFASGAVLRERLVSCDDDQRRLAWTIVDGPYTHHHGVAEIVDDGRGVTTFVWTTDLLPDHLAETTAQAMERGLDAIVATFAL
jgi:hypothetical protein